jgi:hypothetical protein
LCMLHALPIASSLIWPPNHIWWTVKLWSSSSSSSLCSSSICVVPLRWKTKFHTYTKQEVKLKFCTF